MILAWASPLSMVTSRAMCVQSNLVDFPFMSPQQTQGIEPMLF